MLIMSALHTTKSSNSKLASPF